MKNKKLVMAQKGHAEVKLEKEFNEHAKEKLRTELETVQAQYEMRKKMVEKDIKDIEVKMRQRDLLNKDVLTAEEDERRKEAILKTLENELKKLQNEI